MTNPITSADVLRSFTVATRTPTDNYPVPHIRERVVVDVAAMASRIAADAAKIADLETRLAAAEAELDKVREQLQATEQARDIATQREAHFLAANAELSAKLAAAGGAVARVIEVVAEVGGTWGQKTQKRVAQWLVDAPVAGTLLYTHPPVVELDEWRVVDNEGRTVKEYATEAAASGQPTQVFAQWLDSQHPDYAPHRVMRVCLVPVEVDRG